MHGRCFLWIISVLLMFKIVSNNLKILFGYCKNKVPNMYKVLVPIPSFKNMATFRVIFGSWFLSSELPGFNKNFLVFTGSTWLDMAIPDWK